jgi:phosphatidylglycerol:prolipoprotein diacylglycerol transferase
LALGSVIPYFELRSIDVGGLHVPTFGALLTMGIVVGHLVMVRRARTCGMSGVDGLAVASVAGGVVGNWLAGAVANGIEPAALSSLPTLAGSLAGAAAFVRMRRLPFARCADIGAYAFPFGWSVARTGCALVHDHLGRLSESPLAVRFPDGARFDAGLAEALCMPILVALALALGRAPRRTGVLAGAMLGGYGVIRLGVAWLCEGAQWSTALVWLTAVIVGAMIVIARLRPTGEPSRRDAD